ncbi:gliding motility-associated C-terminal domain-containing protein [Chryseobacterium antibioticum]|uniref:Gliding motility-associated C-terminal domain-containing protein n=1 Tax=Chryseobacterium pyrolae TaxID=2987481 RepID=A0ABT2IF89_9FLAO|nr:T9SS type B sorting domain-containing protein [Chryseobacterium pyrolae]MCT2407298.1 gliding motility-associated C-terminal domain-containing protein [Chryseobacterium pyrolae]
MKKFLLAICTFLCLFVNAQLDTEHWFAPMSASSLQGAPQCYLYLSTNETVPFSVQVSNNNTVFSTVQVSKGNPVQMTVPTNYMIASTANNLFTQNSMGLHAKGPKKFFANFRFSVPSQAEIITSKGLAGIGKTFFIGTAPTTYPKDYVSSTVGVTATEDNTTVTLSGYNPDVVFSNGSVMPTRTFTINKGKSYIIDVISDMGGTSNRKGLLGAKLVANKPVSVTNGNFNGLYTTQNNSNVDILMDQAVPVDRLGKDFVMVKGNGPATSGMEKALIIATEDNTTLIVNGNPVPGVTLNAGGYYMIEGTNYINQGNGNYNMNISASKNVYVYQLLAGTSGNTVYQTGGMNFIPPLSCFLPKEINEIGFINRIGTTYYDTKLNIITQVGAVVTLNNNPLAAATGPYPVTGNPGWVTYSVMNVSGNITVNSTKPVTAGIAAGNGAVGYGGYFAGFSSVPAITKTGDCYAGIRLEVDNSYDAYQWYFNGVAIPGATSYFINPELYGAGTYTCFITKNNCESRMTSEYQYTLCPPISTTTYNIGSCNTKMITPVFTNSTQVIVPSHTNIIAQPTNGTATVDPATGQITYTPNAGLTADATDSFIYYIDGNGNPADFEYFKVVVNIDVLQTQNATLSSCANANGNGTFNLTSAVLSPDSGTTATYYTNANLTGQITSPATYSGPAGTIYANVTSAFGCTKTAQITLALNPSPNVNTSNFNASFCDDNFDGIISVNFTTVTPQIVANAANFTVKYYLVQADATAGNNNTLPANWTYNTSTTVYVRVTATVGDCPPAFGQINFTIGNKIPLITNSVTTDVCDNDLSGSESANLNDYKNLFTADPSVILSFHATLADAQAGTNTISPTQNITSVHTYYVRFQNNTVCPATGVLKLTLKTPKKSDMLHNQVVCSDEKVILDAGPGFSSYLWSNGATTQSITVGAGNYYVDLGSNGCVYRQTVSVTTAQAPTITRIETSGSNATVYVTGGTPPYQYSLDGINYQTSNVFIGLSRGIHKAYVLGSDGCSPVTKEFLVLNLVNAITPNGDGLNDVLNYSDLKIKQNVSIEVADRYGASVYKSTDKNYAWDGKVNGRSLPTGTYWYVITWTEPDTKLPVSYSGWLLIKNRD